MIRPPLLFMNQELCWKRLAFRTNQTVSNEKTLYYRTFNQVVFNVHPEPFNKSKIICFTQKDSLLHYEK